MKAQSIADRIKAQHCSDCKHAARGVKRHAVLDEIFERHKKEHKSTKQKELVGEESAEMEPFTPTTKGLTTKGLTPAALQILSRPPSQATMESHKWQAPFIQIVTDQMPNNDKFGPSQILVIDEVVDLTFEYAWILKHLFPATTEENDRPRVVGTITGLLLLVGDQPQVKAEGSPVQYYIQVEDGNELKLIPTSPPRSEACVKTEALHFNLQHNKDNKELQKKWKMDFLLFSRLTIDENAMWIPRILLETKGDDVGFKNLFQTSAGGWKLLLQRLQNDELIDRLYLEVWGNKTFNYGIMDVFGYVTVKDGKVQQESVALYTQTVQRRKQQFGDKYFPEDSFMRCPATLDEFQKFYDNTVASFYRKFHCHLTSQSGIEDMPVGVVYLNEIPRALPSGQLEVTKSQAAAFVQTHASILGSKAISKGNDWLLANLIEGRKNLLEKGRSRFYLSDNNSVEHITAIRRPKENMSDSVAQLSGQSSTTVTADALKHPPTRATVEMWSNEDVKAFVTLVCGHLEPGCKRRIEQTRMDGSRLLTHRPAMLDKWYDALELEYEARQTIEEWLDNVKKRVE